MTTDTQTDARLTFWAAREHSKGELESWRQERAGVCGCTRCGDQQRRLDCDSFIKFHLAQIAKYEDWITG